MKKNQTLTTENQNRENEWKKIDFNEKRKISFFDQRITIGMPIVSWATLSLPSIYLLLFERILLFQIAMLFLAGLFGSQVISKKTKFLGLEVKGRNIFYIILGLTTVLGIVTIPAPAHAFIFNELEARIISISNALNSVDESTINVSFDMIRIIIALIFVGGIAFAIFQAQQGQNVQPIFNVLLVILAAVISVEVGSLLILGSSENEGAKLLPTTDNLAGLVFPSISLLSRMNIIS